MGGSAYAKFSACWLPAKFLASRSMADPGSSPSMRGSRLTCAAACYALNRVEEAKQELMAIALPYGFITPFSESASVFGGLIEQCLKQHHPDYYGAITEQWNRTFTNWSNFHNRFMHDNITLILSLRDYELVLLAARGMPFSEIAKQHNISLGYLHNIMQEIYATLLITKKSELNQFIL